MKNKIKFLIICIIATLCFATISIADVGNFESYDSDFGGSSWDSDWGGSSWDSDYDIDYDSSYSGDDDGGIVLFVIVVVVMIIFGIGLGGSSKGGKVTNNYVKNTETNSNNNSNVLFQIKQVDPYFNEDTFLAWTKNLFIKLQNAWTDRDFEVIRPYETEELFEHHSNQIKCYIENKQINVMDRIAVNFARLHSFEQDNDKDIISVVLNSSMADYIIDEETKEVIQGDKVTRRTNTYLMTFIRKKGVMTKESTSELKVTNCPNCGAPTTITSSGKCEYCASVITTGEHDWVLSNLEPYR